MIENRTGTGARGRVAVKVFAAASLATLTLWLAGVVVSDRYLLTQFLSWIPGWIALLASACALSPAVLIFARLRPAPREVRIFIIAVVILAVACLRVAVIDLRLANVVLRSGAPVGVSILTWNISGVGIRAVRGVIETERPDVAVLLNPTFLFRPDPLIRQFGPAEAVVWEHGIIVLSKVPIRRYGAAELGLDRIRATGLLATLIPESRNSDRGRGLFVELDFESQLGESLVLWALDLPSDWRKPRRSIATAVAGITSTWPGPDVAVGDFNIPRGAHSLSLLLPGMTHAFDQAGTGRVATYPGSRPLIHIDHTFVGPPFRSSEYRVIKTGAAALHLPQIATVLSRSE